MQALKVSNSLLDAEKTTLKKFEKVVGKIDWSEAAEALLDVGPVKSAAYPSEIIDYLNVYTDAMSDMG